MARQEFTTALRWAYGHKTNMDQTFYLQSQNVMYIVTFYLSAIAYSMNSKVSVCDIFIGL